MTKIAVFGAILTLGTLVTDWARASEANIYSECDSEATAAYESVCRATWNADLEDCGSEADSAYEHSFDVCLARYGLDSADGRLCTAGAPSQHESNAAFYDYMNGCYAEQRAQDAMGATLDVDTFNMAARNIEAAPAFCAVVTIQRDATRGYVAVCELDSEGGAL
jgi:hypothetical protein